MEKKAARVFLIFFLIGIGAGIVAGWLFGKVAVPPGEHAQERSASMQVPEQQSPISPQQLEQPASITVYFGDERAMYLHAEQRIVKDSEADLAAVVIGELIRGPEGQGLVRTMPQNARLRRVWVEEGVAYVDFSREFQTEHWGGSTGDTFT